MADGSSGVPSAWEPAASCWEENVERDGLRLELSDGRGRPADTIDGSRGADGVPRPVAGPVGLLGLCPPSWWLEVLLLLVFLLSALLACSWLYPLPWLCLSWP